MVFVLVLGDPERSASTTWDPPGPKLALFRRCSGPAAAGLVVLSGAVLLVAVWRVTTDPLPPGPRDQHYPGMDWAALVVMIVAATALVVLAAANGLLALQRMRAGHRSEHRWSGRQPRVVAAYGHRFAMRRDGQYPSSV